MKVVKYHADGEYYKSKQDVRLSNLNSTQVGSLNERKAYMKHHHLQQRTQ
jgi:hypothetical protein